MILEKLFSNPRLAIGMDENLSFGGVVDQTYIIGSSHLAKGLSEFDITEALIVLLIPKILLNLLLRSNRNLSTHPPHLLLNPHI